MKYMKGVITLPIEEYCQVVTEKAYGLSCWNGARGTAGREWVEFFPKSQVRFGNEREGKTDVYVPYWLFASKGIYPRNVMGIGFDTIVTM